MPNRTKSEVQRGQIRDAGNEQKQRTKSDESDQKQHPVDPHPVLMPVEIVLKGSADDCLRLIGREIVRVRSSDGRFASEVPQQALFGYTFRNPRHHPIV